MTVTSPALPTSLTTGTWSVDPTHSEIGFAVRHVGLTKVRGRFNEFGGRVVVGDSLPGTSIEATVEDRVYSITFVTKYDSAFA